jgi:hypothetical protein
MYCTPVTHLWFGRQQPLLKARTRHVRTKPQRNPSKDQNRLTAWAWPQSGRATAPPCARSSATGSRNSPGNDLAPSRRSTRSPGRPLSRPGHRGRSICRRHLERGLRRAHLGHADDHMQAGRPQAGGGCPAATPRAAPASAPLNTSARPAAAPPPRLRQPAARTRPWRPARESELMTLTELQLHGTRCGWRELTAFARAHDRAVAVSCLVGVADVPLPFAASRGRGTSARSASVLCGWDSGAGLCPRMEGGLCGCAEALGI